MASSVRYEVLEVMNRRKILDKKALAIVKSRGFQGISRLLALGARHQNSRRFKESPRASSRAASSRTCWTAQRPYACASCGANRSFARVDRVDAKISTATGIRTAWGPGWIVGVSRSQMIWALDVGLFQELPCIETGKIRGKTAKTSLVRRWRSRACWRRPRATCLRRWMGPWRSSRRSSKRNWTRAPFDRRRCFKKKHG